MHLLPHFLVREFQLGVQNVKSIFLPNDPLAQSVGQVEQIDFPRVNGCMVAQLFQFLGRLFHQAAGILFKKLILDDGQKVPFQSGIIGVDRDQSFRAEEVVHVTSGGIGQGFIFEVGFFKKRY